MHRMSYFIRFSVRFYSRIVCMLQTMVLYQHGLFLEAPGPLTTQPVSCCPHRPSALGMVPLSVEIQLSYFIQVPEITLRETFGVSRTLLGVL